MQPSCSNRAPEAGVTLIEMLVVLTIFAVVAGLAVLTVPQTSGAVQDGLTQKALQARITAAVDQALRTERGFAIWQGNGDLLLLTQSENGQWVPAEDILQNSAKLFSTYSRISIQEDDDGVFVVSPALVPVSGIPLRIQTGNGPDLIFDGLRVRTEDDHNDAQTGKRF